MKYVTYLCRELKNINMKKLEFTTSKGDFVLIDIDSLSREYKEQYFCNYINNFKGLCIDDVLYEEVSGVAEITEEQASDVVDTPQYNHYINYGYTNAALKWVRTAKESIDSLLKSKGIYLYENPYQDVGLIPSYEQKLYRDSQDLTFHTPYLFKKLK